MPEYKLSVAMRDAYTRDARKSFDVVAADYATAQTNAANFLTDLAALSMLQVLDYSLTEKTDYSDTVTALANRDEGVTFSLTIAGQPGKKAVTKLFGPEKAIFNTDGTVDLTDALVTAYFTHFLSGFVRVSDGEQVGTLESGRLDR